MVTLPPWGPASCFCIARTSTASGILPILTAATASSQTSRARTELPRRLVTQTLPWLSTASPLAETDLELFYLARIGCGKSGHKIGGAVGNPNPVLLVNYEVER